MVVGVMPGADAVSACELVPLEDPLEHAARASMPAAATARTTALDLRLFCSGVFMDAFFRRESPAWQGRAREFANRPLQAFREAEHDDDQDRAVGGHRDVGTD